MRQDLKDSLKVLTFFNHLEKSLAQSIYNKKLIQCSHKHLRKIPIVNDDLFRNMNGRARGRLSNLKRSRVPLIYSFDDIVDCVHTVLVI